MKRLNIIQKIKDFKFPYKIIKVEEYELLKDVEASFLAHNKDVPPMSDAEEIVLALTTSIRLFGIRCLLKRIKRFKEKNNEI